MKKEVGNMKEKIILVIISLLILIGAIFTFVIIKSNTSEEKLKKERTIALEPVADDCTEEYKIAQQESEIEEVSASEDKISSNSALILKKYYKDCGHTINEYAEMLPELVNMTEDQINDEFADWDLIGFNSKEVTLFKEFEGTCGEHFSLKEEKGFVVIYKILEDGTKQIYEETEISTEFLPETDLIRMQSEEGIQVYGKEELKKVLEDFE